MTSPHPPWPMHRKLATAGWTCLSVFLFFIFADEIAKHLSLPRLEQWPLVGLCASVGTIPLLLAGSVCLLLTPIARQRHRILQTPHACRQCEYDRRGLQPGAPCPECGHLPSPPPPTDA